MLVPPPGLEQPNQKVEPFPSKAVRDHTGTESPLSIPGRTSWKEESSKLEMADLGRPIPAKVLLEAKDDALNWHRNVFVCVCVCICLC